MAQRQALLAVHQALEKCFQVIEQQQNSWDSTLTECIPLLSSLSNLAEQLQACNKVVFKNTPFREFPDLQLRLKYKLTQAMEINLEKLGEKMNVLQRVRDTTNNQVAMCFQMYEQHADTIGLTAVLERSCLCPSVADMLEWLQDVERFYRSQYLSRKLLLQRISSDNLPNIQTLPQSWSSVSEQMDQDLVRDTLLKVSYFMETRQGS
ncbi:AFG2-interacting ribosome maturation factor isoform X2 [Heterodontus francisci]|uniref:AFG2-interacting ribosome maturation factor isoform X2 n=1 Tax=Heterodontus francisci TaxID=7792 RepID=UPI00355BF72D